MDRSQTAERAVAWAGELAGRYGAELVIVQVIPAENGEVDIAEAEASLLELARELAGERGRARVRIRPRSAAGRSLRAIDETGRTSSSSATSGMSGRKEFLLGNVPEPRLAQRALHGRDRQHGSGIEARRASAGSASRADAGGELLGRAAQIGRVLAKYGLARARPRRHDARRGARAPPARGARGARADLRQARPDPVDAARPAAARVRRGARDAAGQRAAADRGGGRRRDGAGARRSVGGRVRVDRPRAARGGHDRPGAPRHARRRRARRRQGAAPDARATRSCATSACSSSSPRRRPSRPALPAAGRHARRSSSTSPTSLRRELDFRHEAANIERMRTVLEPYDRLDVPRVYDELLDGAAARDGGDPGRADPRGAGGRRAQEAARSCSSPTTARSSPTASSTPTRIPGNLMWWDGQDLLPRLRHGRRGRRRGCASCCCCCSWRSGRRTCRFLADVMLMLAGEHGAGHRRGGVRARPRRAAWRRYRQPR